MTNLQIIESLCSLVEEQSKVIRYLMVELAHERELTKAETDMVNGTSQKYSSILGHDETPDDLPV